MAAALALVAAFLFALSATLLPKGPLTQTIAIAHSSLSRPPAGSPNTTSRLSRRLHQNLSVMLSHWVGS